MSWVWLFASCFEDCPRVSENELPEWCSLWTQSNPNTERPCWIIQNNTWQETSFKSCIWLHIFGCEQKTTLSFDLGIQSLAWSLRQFVHQNVGYLRIRESGRVYEKVHEEGPETEKIPRLFPVPHTERPGGALPAAAAQRYGKRMKGAQIKVGCLLCVVLDLQHLLSACSPKPELQQT